MKRALIWDLPTRLFHWLLAAGFLAAAGIAFLLGDDGPLFPWHAILGLVIAGMVVLRVVWGLVGTRHARFASFAFGPGAVVGYLKSAITGGGKRFAGHNPGSAWAVLAILVLVLAQAATGLLMSRGNESLKELHELIAYATLVLVGAHLAGVIFHTLRHRENITASMIHGRKDTDPEQAIGSTRPVMGLVFLAISGAWAGALAANYDSASQTTQLPLLGTQVSLGEGEDEREGGRAEREGGTRESEEGEEDDD